MTTKHSIYDQDNYFILDPVTRTWTNAAVQKHNLIQGDHNSEAFTFRLPRFIEGHDMAECDAVQVHYINVDSVTREQSCGVYEVEDLQLNPDGSETITCSWVISQHATKYVGVLHFLLRFACYQEDGTADYVWQSAIDSSVVVAKGINAGDVVVEAYPDILAQWHQYIEQWKAETPDWVAKTTGYEGAPVWSEKTVNFTGSIAFCSDNGGNFKVDVGVDYDVYWNGRLYRCTAKQHDDGPYLGNGSLAFGASSVENTREPFCLYGVFLAPDTIAYIKKGTNTAEAVTIKVTVGGNIEFNKMPVEYLPDGVAMLDDIPEGGGGSGIDVTAEVGQTIVVEEVDGNGKPTKWKAAEYQPRTHWTEVVEGDLVPHMAFTPVLNEAFQMLLYNLPTFDFEAGKTYTVVYDGVEYTGTAEAGVFNGLNIVTVGNAYLTTGTPTAEPFIVSKITAMNVLAVICLGEEESHTIRIIGEKTVYNRIPYEYLEYRVNIGVNSALDGYEVNVNWDELKAVIRAGMTVTARYAYENENGEYFFETYRLARAEIDLDPTNTTNNATDCLYFVSGLRNGNLIAYPNLDNSVNRTTIEVRRYADGRVETKLTDN